MYVKKTYIRIIPGLILWEQVLWFILVSSHSIKWLGGEKVEKNNSKVIAIVALVVAVVALSVGFATYSATLTIASDANVVITANDTFSPNVKYRASSMQCNASGSATVVSAGSVSDTAWSGIAVTLAQPGDYVTCNAVIENNSGFVGYLKEINTASTISCAAITGQASTANSSLVSSICATTSLAIAVGSNSATATSTAAASNTNIAANNTIAAINGTTPGTNTVSITITYGANAPIPDGDVRVNLPQVNLIYKTEN